MCENADPKPVFTSTVEEWRPVPGYDGIEASSEGRVRIRVSVRRAVLLDAYPCGNDYLGVTVKSRSVKVYALVAAAFLGPRPHDYVVVHTDGDPTNNTASTLAYVSRGEALHRAYVRCTRQPTYGVSDPRRSAGLTEEKVREIRDNPEVRPSFYAAKFFVTCNCISAVRSRKTWKHVS
jgi:hypothetical protein